MEGREMFSFSRLFTYGTFGNGYCDVLKTQERRTGTKSEGGQEESPRWTEFALHFMVLTLKHTSRAKETRTNE